MIADGMVVVLLGSGVALMLVAAVGLLRLPDPLCRSHAVAKAVSLGVILILLGAWVELGVEEAGLKLALAIVFQLITIPVASHLLGRTAVRLGLPRWKPGTGAKGDAPGEAGRGEA